MGKIEGYDRIAADKDNVPNVYVLWDAPFFCIQ